MLQDEYGRGAVTATVKEILEKSRMHDKLKADNEELAWDNEERKKIINELRAKSNGIKAVPAKDRPKKGSRPRGRQKGCKPTINTAPENVDRE